MNSLFELFFLKKLQDQEHQLPTEWWHGNPFVLDQMKIKMSKD